MLKNKFKIIVILMLAILCFMVPIVRAQNEVATNDDINLISEEPVDEDIDESSLDQSDLKSQDVYLLADDVTIDYIVDGNLFVIADTVTINSQIGGDAFILAKTVNVGEEGYIYSNLFTIAQNLNISGIVYDIYAVSEDIVIDGYVCRDIKTSSNSLAITGVVGRNAFVSASTINFEQTSNSENDESSYGSISGDLNYSSSKEISVPDEVVSGNLNFTEIKKLSPDVQTYLLSLGTFLTTVAIIWLLCLWITPKFLNNTSALLTKKTLPILGYGILTPIVVIIAFIILLIVGITSSIAFLTFSLFLLLMCISSSIFVIAINNMICNKFKVEKNIGKLGMLLVSSTAFWLINLIPYLGSLVSFVASIIGLGILVISIIPAKKKIKSEDVEKDKNTKNKSE